jgi:erythromycin esterase-like protein
MGQLDLVVLGPGGQRLTTNEHHARGERVAFHGLDLYSMYTSIAAVLEYLDRVDPKTAQLARTRYACLTP